MPIAKALLLKGLGGLAVLGSTIGGGYFVYDYYSNQETEFDRGLIDYLEAGGKIQFSVKDGTSDISDSFPDFTNGTTPPTATVTIKVSVGTDAGTNDGTLTDATTDNNKPVPKKGKKETLQKLNGDGTNDGTAWTWICKLEFKKTGSGTEFKDKDKLVQSSDPKGFFNKLKDADANTKDLKIKFIKDCAAARGTSKNKKINKKKNLNVIPDVITTANQIEVSKTFKLIDNFETQVKLIPENQSDFNYWFGIK